jgi:hypothetical protein
MQNLVVLFFILYTEISKHYIIVLHSCGLLIYAENQRSATASLGTPGATATDGSGTQGVGVVPVEDGSVDDDPVDKKQKKCTSGVWEYFDKYLVTVEVNGKQETQHWAKCKFKGCKNKTSKGRCESRFGTTGFWTHLRHYHSIVKGQQQLKTENDETKGVTIVKPFKYDQDESLQKF